MFLNNISIKGCLAVITLCWTFIFNILISALQTIFYRSISYPNLYPLLKSWKMNFILLNFKIFIANINEIWLKHHLIRDFLWALLSISSGTFNGLCKLLKIKFWVILLLLSVCLNHQIHHLFPTLSPYLWKPKILHFFFCYLIFPLFYWTLNILILVVNSSSLLTT